MTETTHLPKGVYPYVNCPHCDIFIEIIELNCCIFRCGIYKHNYTQIPPHSTKSECDRLIKNHEIYGCGKPFRIRTCGSKHPYTYKIESCDYV
jgi:hypothetical protein